MLALLAFRVWSVPASVRAFFGPCAPGGAVARSRTSEIRRSLEEDHEAHIQNIVVEAVSAAEKHDIRVLHALVKRRKLPCLPMYGLRMALWLRPPGRGDGSVFTLPRSLRRRVWWRLALFPVPI